ncbi:MAG: hypothetical protein V1712_04400 [Patescibacteria group bacterium]
MNNTLNTKIAPFKVRMFYFILALFSIIAYRSIIILNNVSEFWVSFAWYLGTITVTIYYIHRYQISKKRLAIIKQYKLDEKVELLSALGVHDKEALHYLLESLESSTERWNYLLTFITTILALIIGIIIDILNYLK